MEVQAAALSDFGASELLSVHVQNLKILLVRQDDGSIKAFEDCCTHEQVELSGSLCEGGSITCPAHGARFDLNTGAALCLPAVKPLKRFPCFVREGLVFIEISG